MDAPSGMRREIVALCLADRVERAPARADDVVEERDAEDPTRLGEVLGHVEVSGGVGSPLG